MRALLPPVARPLRLPLLPPPPRVVLLRLQAARPLRLPLPPPRRSKAGALRHQAGVLADAGLFCLGGNDSRARWKDLARSWQLGDNNSPIRLVGSDAIMAGIIHARDGKNLIRLNWE